MKQLSLPVALVVGAAFGVAAVVACSDDSPGDADAAACDCPASEPPLANRVVRVRATIAVPAMGSAGQGVSCATGATLLSGGCRTMDHNINVFLTEAGPTEGGGQGYSCDWKSMSPLPETGIAEAICLMPAP